MKQDIVCHRPRRSGDVFEGCRKLQPGQIKSVQEEAKKKKDRLEPEAMAQISQRNCRFGVSRCMKLQLQASLKHLFFQEGGC